MNLNILFTLIYKLNGERISPNKILLMEKS